MKQESQQNRQNEEESTETVPMSKRSRPASLVVKMDVDEVPDQERVGSNHHETPKQLEHQGSVELGLERVVQRPRQRRVILLELFLPETLEQLGGLRGSVLLCQLEVFDSHGASSDGPHERKEPEEEDPRESPRKGEGRGCSGLRRPSLGSECLGALHHLEELRVLVSDVVVFGDEGAGHTRLL